MFRIALIVVGSPISIRRKQHETRKSWVLSNYNGPYFGIRGGQLHLPRTYFNVSFSLSLSLSQILANRGVWRNANHNLLQSGRSPTRTLIRGPMKNERSIWPSKFGSLSLVTRYFRREGYSNRNLENIPSLLERKYISKYSILFLISSLLLYFSHYYLISCNQFIGTYRYNWNDSEFSNEINSK